MKLKKLKTINEAIEDIAVSKEDYGTMGFVMADAIRTSKKNRERADAVMHEKIKELPNEDRFAHTKDKGTPEMKKMHLSEDAFQTIDLRNRGNKSRKALKESVDGNKLARFIDNSIKGLQNGDATNYRFKLDDRLAVFVGWSDGYDEKDDDIIHDKEYPTFGINVGVKVWTSDDMWTDYDFLNFAYDEDSGETIDSEVSVSPNYNANNLADSMIDYYNDLKDLTIEEDGKIIDNVKESFKSIVGRKPIKESTDDDDVSFNKLQGNLDFIENNLNKQIKSIESKLGESIFSLFGDYCELLNTCNRHKIPCSSFELPQPYKYQQDNYCLYVEPDQDDPGIILEFYDKGNSIDTFFMFVYSVDGTVTATSAPEIEELNTMWDVDDLANELSNKRESISRFICLYLQQFVNDMQRAINRLTRELNRNQLGIGESLKSRRTAKNESFLNETGEVDSKKCADILNNWIDWTEVDETGDVDFAINQLRSLATEKQITDEEYDFIMSNWDDLLKEGLSYSNKDKKLEEGMKFGQSSYDDAVKVVIDYYRDHSVEDALESIFNEFQVINEDEAYKLVYSLAERVEEFVGEDLEDSQKYPIESPFDKKEGKGGLKATQKYPVESPMKKKDSQFVKAEQKAPVGLTESIDEKSVSFDKILPIVKDWCKNILGEEDCENLAQEFSIGMSEGKDCFDILNKVAGQYGLDVDEFEGICGDIESILTESTSIDCKKKLNEDVKIISDLYSFKPWSGAVDTWYKIIDAGKLDTLDFMLEDMYPEGISDVGLNDLLWHDAEWVLDMVGISEEQDDEENDEDEIEDVEESLDKNKIGKGSEYDIDVSPEEADKLAESLVNTINSLENN